MLKLVYLPSRLAPESGLYPKQLRIDTAYKTKLLVNQTFSTRLELQTCTRFAEGFITNAILETQSNEIISLYHFYNYSLLTTARQHCVHTSQLTYLENVEEQQIERWSLRTLASVPSGFSRLSIVARPETGPRVRKGNI